MSVEARLTTIEVKTDEHTRNIKEIWKQVNGHTDVVSKIDLEKSDVLWNDYQQKEGSMKILKALMAVLILLQGLGLYVGWNQKSHATTVAAVEARH